MVKVCLKQFPKGTYAGQQGDGYYINELTKVNLDVLARNITKDMQFVGLYTGDGTVRNGKSTCAFQHAYYYSSKVSQLTKKNIPFTLNNVVFRAKDLIERAFTLPKYSCIVLDEGDDLTAHYFSKLAQELKKFFRKCGQLNLFIILILPNFFEIPKNYALTRSNYLCNIYFQGEFKRGYFNFYGQKKKKDLYLKGKKEENYSACRPGFRGKFVKLYVIGEEEYRHAKYDDMLLEEQEEISPKVLLSNYKMEVCERVMDMFPKLSSKDTGVLLDVTKAQINNYKIKIRGNPLGNRPKTSEKRQQYTKITNKLLTKPNTIGADV